MTETAPNPNSIDHGEVLDRISVNTLRTLDSYMQDVADGKAELQTPVLRATIDLLKMNKELLEERRTEGDRLSNIKTMIAQMPDFETTT
jgi:GTP:adenosylcobinamide-phosphate guanylyltransferase